MNKIFISDRPLYLYTQSEPQAFHAEYSITFSTVNELKKSIVDFEKNAQLNSMSVIFETRKQLEKAIYSIFKIIEAAGGIVKNSQEQILFIFRHGKWDLPKGKIEKGEAEKSAALREVEEECGISELILESKFCSTYHTYELKGKSVLKISHWYKMQYKGKSSLLSPQTEEGITEAKWLSDSEIPEAMKNTYASIDEVMKLYRGENK